MLNITSNSIKLVNNEIKDLRAYDTATANICRKIFDNIKCKPFGTIPVDGKELASCYTGPEGTFSAYKASNILIEFLDFEEAPVDNTAGLDIPEIELSED